jgi:hypothetical protein
VLDSDSHNLINIHVGADADTFERHRHVNDACVQRRLVILRKYAVSSDPPVYRSTGNTNGNLASIGNEYAWLFQFISSFFADARGLSSLVFPHSQKTQLSNYFLATLLEF